MDLRPLVPKDALKNHLISDDAYESFKSEDYNQFLIHRENAIREYLITLGIPVVLINDQSLSESIELDIEDTN